MPPAFLIYKHSSLEKSMVLLYCESVLSGNKTLEVPIYRQLLSQSLDVIHNYLIFLFGSVQVRTSSIT